VLVLTRHPKQSIMIGDDIEVSVLSVTGNKVRIGIQAPSDVPVFRTEIYLEIQQDREREAKPRPTGEAKPRPTGEAKPQANDRDA
jgi:carbon storage regulator